MTTFTNIANTDIAQDKPIKAETGLALRDNPVSIAEGGSGAPKIAKKILSGEVASGGFVTISDLDDFGGILIDGVLNNATQNGLSFFFSDDGGTSFSSELLLAEWPSGLVPFRFWLDFASGDWAILSNVGSTSGNFRTAGTIAGSSNNITDLRFQNSTGSLAFIAEPNGGQSAT